ncbi:Tyrosyl-tRNA synthetase [Spironucleus salmonicida]|uniref:tyrosine--tRNA ligase n=1 Tax=Spironucleus salmonicida TaxID=348837 RepID=V6M4L0_9EUKA|nr:Tyrosyl-tRNA synthetase [Spironucleus salmonicida]|eukprot:EST48274.1 Tyrosyl-tRNA synthetase [Spironucleus salmonicida]
MSQLTLEEKLAIFNRVGEEILDVTDLSQLLTTKPSPLVYDGFEPSGRIHIAQGLMKAINVNRMAQCGCKSLFYVADWFALLNGKCAGNLEAINKLGNYFIEVWKAVGMDMNAVEFVWNSDFIKNDKNYFKRVIQIARNFNLARSQRCSTALGRQESDNQPIAQILYPCMQAADVFELSVDICQLGMDQRKVNMLARDFAGKIKIQKPVIVSHHMLLGLIGGKMSKSVKGSAVFMDDSREDIAEKVMGADCELQVENNPVLEYFKYIVYGAKEVTLGNFNRDIKINSKSYPTYETLETGFLTSEFNREDMKKELVDCIDILVSSVREAFNNNKELQELQKFVMEMRLTR